MRGSPHAHCLLWVKDAPKIDEDPDEVVCKFIDKYITATIPNDTNRDKQDMTLMQSLQKHAHFDYCHSQQNMSLWIPKTTSTSNINIRSTY